MLAFFIATYNRACYKNQLEYNKPFKENPTMNIKLIALATILASAATIAEAGPRNWGYQGDDAAFNTPNIADIEPAAGPEGDEGMTSTRQYDMQPEGQTYTGITGEFEAPSLEVDANKEAY